MKSPLLAYKSDMRGNYANPKYVKEELVGVKIGEALTKAGTDIFSGLTTKPKSESGDGSNGGSNITNNIFANGSNGGGGESRKSSIEIPEIGDTSIKTGKYVHEFKTPSTTPTNETSIPTSTPDDNYNTKLRKLITPGQEVEKLESNQETYRNSFNAGFAKNNEGYDNIDDYIKFKESKYQPKKQMFAQDYKNNVAQGDEYEVDIDNQKTNYSVMNMKGSPVKHNAGAAGAIASANPLAGGIAGIGQQISNQAQQRAADAGGSTGVDPFLPPPNQVAETGSYGGGGDRDMLEMNGNQINNQSIGRNTDITSQLFGSGQRASMLAMKGTPLHTEGHGGAKDHTHAKPGDYLDQTVAEEKGVFDIEDYNPIQEHEGKQIVVNSKTKDSIFSNNQTFVIPKQMEGITRSPEGTPKYKPIFINRNKKQ